MSLDFFYMGMLGNMEDSNNTRIPALISLRICYMDTLQKPLNHHIGFLILILYNAIINVNNFVFQNHLLPLQK